MLLKRTDLDRIVVGEVDRAYRRWKRPTVKSGGTLTTAVGVLAIDEVAPVDPESLTRADARRAGFGSLEALHAALDRRPEGTLYRIDLRWLGEDPRRALRADAELSDDEMGTLRARLARLDARAPEGPWTEAVLRLVAARPGVRAADLAPEVSLEKTTFKRNVRKLKALGLTESSRVGYRVSPRGRAVLDAWDAG